MKHKCKTKWKAKSSRREQAKDRISEPKDEMVIKGKPKNY
jgi:hypothetical protein